MSTKLAPITLAGATLWDTARGHGRRRQVAPLAEHYEGVLVALWPGGRRFVVSAGLVAG
jgi:hypothetical protein